MRVLTTLTTVGTPTSPPRLPTPLQYTRWIQVGAFSGVMRSHDRGMSGGGCANSYSRVTAPGWGPPTGDCAYTKMGGDGFFMTPVAGRNE